MEKLTKEQKEFIESRLTKVPSILIDITEIMKREYFEDPHRQAAVLAIMLDSASDLIALCHSLINCEYRENFLYPSELKCVEIYNQ